MHRNGGPCEHNLSSLTAASWSLVEITYNVSFLCFFTFTVGPQMGRCTLYVWKCARKYVAVLVCRILLGNVRCSLFRCKPFING